MRRDTRGEQDVSASELIRKKRFDTFGSSAWQNVTHVSTDRPSGQIL